MIATPKSPVSITGLGCHVPERVVTNDDLAKIVDTNDEWIRTRTGIRERRYAAPDEALSDIALPATRAALEQAGVAARYVDLLIVATVTPDMVFPSTAAILADHLGAADAAAFDLSAGCTGFMYGITQAAGMIGAGLSRKAVVVGADVLSRVLNMEDRSTCVLFGDGAGAVVLEASNEPGIITTKLHADGGYKHLLYNPVGVSAGFRDDEPNHGIRVMMTGNEVFKVAVKTLDRIVGETLEAANMHESDVDWLIPHQANLRIIEATAKRLKLSMDRVVVTVDRHGNTSSGSVPLALDEAVRAGRIQRGQTVLLEAFGGGFTWSSALLKY